MSVPSACVTSIHDRVHDFADVDTGYDHSSTYVRACMHTWMDAWLLPGGGSGGGQAGWCMTACRVEYGFACC